MIGAGYTVTGDLYCIASRLKSIDEGYFIWYSYKNKRFEVHNTSQRGSTLSLVLPYASLDERTVRLVLKTRAERARQLFEEIERENRQREKENLYSLVKEKERETELLLKNMADRRKYEQRT